MSKKLLGFIIIDTDEVIENQTNDLMSSFPDVQVKFSKISLADGIVSPDSFIKSAANISTAVQFFHTTPHIVGLACTSMSFTLGNKSVDRELMRDQAITTDMARGQIAALKALKVKSVCLLTPYIDSLSLTNSLLIQDAGIEVLRRRTLNILTDAETSRISQKQIMQMVQEIDHKEADAIVVGCSAFQVCEKGFIDILENTVQKPIITSTQAFLWIMLRKAGIMGKIPGYGEIFKKH